MKSIKAECPDCGGAMYEGYLLDMGAGVQYPVTWVQGPPGENIWVITKARGRKSWTVATYRCEECGLLKSYAREQKT